MDKFSAMIPSSLRLDLEYIANKHNTTISTLVRAFLQRSVDEALEKDEQESEMD
jgi:hypothetical protein